MIIELDEDGWDVCLLSLTSSLMYQLTLNVLIDQLILLILFDSLIE